MKNNKVIPIFITILFCLVFLDACTSSQPSPNQKILSIGMILGSGGLGDRSFNDAAYAGLQETQKLYETRYEIINFTTDEANLAQLESLIRQDYELIIGIGYENAEYIMTLSEKYPDKHFVIVDSVVEGKNITSVIYREQEGDFIMGVLAAMLTQTNTVGFIGGMDIDVINRIESGFKQGVAYQNPSVSVISSIAGTFSDTEIGKSLALEQYSKGADIIYNAAGRTGLGIIEASKEVDKLTIGTSGDQLYLAPGNVVGNRQKRVDTAVLEVVKDLVNGNLVGGIRSLGLKENGLSIGPFDEEIVTDDMQNQLEDLKEKIISGEIIVSDTSN